MTKNKHAVALGSIKSPKKAASSRENGKKGGRPPLGGQTTAHGLTMDWTVSRHHRGDYIVTGRINGVGRMSCQLLRDSPITKARIDALVSGRLREIAAEAK